MKRAILLFCFIALVKALTFRDYFGACNGVSPLSSVMSYSRLDVSFSSTFPAKGNVSLSYLKSVGDTILSLQANQSSQFLPILDYMATWAADTSTREWVGGNYKYKIFPVEGGFNMTTSLNTSGTYVLQKNSGVSIGKFPPGNVSDWENYVTTVVTFLGSSPYEVTHFQIWNEAHLCSSFYWGSWDDYFNKIHLPAAQIIRAAGKKVVFGGHPACGSPSLLVSLLDKYNGWSTLDVVDMHYYNVADMETIRSAVASRGLSTGVWQTEVGFTSQANYISTVYPKFLDWAIQNGQNELDKHRLFYYANWAPNDPAAYGYNHCLNSGSSLSFHGVNLITFGSLFNSSDIANFTQAISSTNLVPYNTYNGCFWAYKTAEAIVVSVVISNANLLLYPNATLNFPLIYGNFSRIQKVDISGNYFDYTDKVENINSSYVQLVVPTIDEPNTLAASWNNGTSYTAFFIYAQFATPSIEAPTSTPSTTSSSSTKDSASTTVNLSGTSMVLFLLGLMISLFH